MELFHPLTLLNRLLAWNLFVYHRILVKFLLTKILHKEPVRKIDLPNKFMAPASNSLSTST